MATETRILRTSESVEWIDVVEHPMAGQLIPLPGMEPEYPQDMTPQQGITIWRELMEAGYKLVLAGLRHDIGPDGDLNAAYRAWYAEQMREHDEVVARVMERINRPPAGEKNAT